MPAGSELQAAGFATPTNHYLRTALIFFYAA
jgi:hypothetical protein